MNAPLSEKGKTIPWIILGDESKYVFVKWCLNSEKDFSTELLKSKDVFIYYSVSSHIEYNENSISVYSSILLPGSFAHIPTSNDQYQFDRINNRIILIFEGFPFGKNIIKNLTDKCRNFEYNVNSVLNVLMDIPNRKGSTDLQLSVDTIAEAEQEYQRKSYNTIRIKGSTDVPSVFYWHESAAHYWQLKAESEIEKLRNKISGFGFDYMEWLTDVTFNSGDDLISHILEPSQLYKLCSFSTIEALQKNRAVSIMDAYWYSAENFLFESVDFNNLLNIFLEAYICDIVSTDLDAVRKKAKNELKHLFYTEIKNLFLNTCDEKRNDWTKDHYHEIITNKTSNLNGINAKFEQCVNSYFGVENDTDNPVVNFCKTALEKHLKELEELIK